MPNEPIRHLAGHLDETSTLTDPLDRIRAIGLLRSEVDELSAELRTALRSAILDARSQTPRPTWSELGSLLGVSAQRAEALSK